jgi:hypothetical protein
MQSYMYNCEIPTCQLDLTVCAATAPHGRLSARGVSSERCPHTLSPDFVTRFAMTAPLCGDKP